jgi:hypothetical protein
MRSSAARLTLGAAAWIAIGAAAAFIVQSEHQLTQGREAVRLFDVRAGDAAVALADARNAQQAYVVPGQNVGVWIARVDAFLKNASATLDELRQVAAGADSRQALLDAGASIVNLRGIDQRAREYLTSAQPLMAADVVFSEGLEMTASVGRQLETARIAEHVAWDSSEAAGRQLQVYSAGGAATFAALVIAFLALAPPAKKPATSQPAPHMVAAATRPSEGYRYEELALHDEQPPASAMESPQAAAEVPREPMPILAAAVEVCTELNRARDADDLNTWLGRVAQTIDASGLIVWVGSAAGANLQPVLAYGYSADALARMPLVARSDDNAAAAAFRTGELQIVSAGPGGSSGALAAPMLSREGCIGALTAEVRNGAEASPEVRAIAAILAAQLAGVLADSIPAADVVEESRIASA